MNFEAKRPAKKESISTIETLFELASLQDMKIDQLKPVVESKNVYLYTDEIQEIVKSKDENFDAKAFVSFCNDLGIINQGEKRTIGSRGARVTPEKATEVAPGNEAKYLELAKLLETTRDEINAIMPNHKWDFALKSMKKAEDVPTTE